MNNHQVKKIRKVMTTIATSKNDYEVIDNIDDFYKVPHRLKRVSMKRLVKITKQVFQRQPNHASKYRWIETFQPTYT